MIFFLKRNEHIRRNHLANKGDGSKIWPGVKQWSHNELEALKETFYGRRTRTTIVSTGYVYGEVKIRSFENKCYNLVAGMSCNNKDPYKNLL